MLEIRHSGPRPGPGWHRHGTTTKTLVTVVDDQLACVVVHKQRWLEVATGRTCHDRPVWDAPNSRYGFDVVVLTLAAWLLGAVGLHATDWAWDDDRPARRSVQRWAADLARHADDWLQRSRRRLVEHVAPRPLEELLPAGGIPPPAGARVRNRQGDVAVAGQPRDVVWLLKNTAHALCIPLRKLLVVARWRWPRRT